MVDDDPFGFESIPLSSLVVVGPGPSLLEDSLDSEAESNGFDEMLSCEGCVSPFTVAGVDGSVVGEVADLQRDMLSKGSV